MADENIQNTPVQGRSNNGYMSDLNTNIFAAEFNKLIESHASEATFGEAKDSSIVQIVNLLLQQGYERKASDIHIEPEREYTLVRFRIDGVMHDIITIPPNIHDLLITRVKIMAKLRTDAHQLPQDGKLNYKFHDDYVDIRVAVLPTIKGENVVMRLLSEKSGQFGLEDLGFSSQDFQKLMKHIRKPWGMILTTGPTGAGKTTSLYAILRILNQREANIITIEDPVEYSIEGITQIQVNPRAKLTFATGLRSIVRQDPNVVMVGEIRDEETAEIAVNAAMTGHLVLSTMHTNDAATTLPRLLEMGIKPFMVASTINVAIGQRLVRKICKACIAPYEIYDNEVYKKIPAEILSKLKQNGDKIRLFKGTGCDACKGTGYLGRIGIYEVLEITNEIKSLIMQNADALTIQAKAIEQGMVTMIDDGLNEVLKGVTTIDEILRVIKQ